MERSAGVRSDAANDFDDSVAFAIRSRRSGPNAIAHGMRTPPPPLMLATIAPSAVELPEGAEAVSALRRMSALCPGRSRIRLGRSEKSMAAAPSSCVRTKIDARTVRVERFVSVSDAFTRQPAPLERPSESVAGDAA